MAIEVMLVQVLVLAFTAVLWWIARRDLAARVPPPVPPAPAADMAELAQLCTTLEALVTSLARRLDAIENAAEVRSIAPAHGSIPMKEPHRVTVPAVTVPVVTVPVAPLPDPRYAPVYALLEAGETDPVEIARQTGLGRGEVDLILSLRDRRTL